MIQFFFHKIYKNVKSVLYVTYKKIFQEEISLHDICANFFLYHVIQFFPQNTVD